MRTVSDSGRKMEDERRGYEKRREMRQLEMTRGREKGTCR